MKFIKAECIHHPHFKSNTIFDLEQICFIYEFTERFIPDGCEDYYNEVPSLEIVFKNGQTLTLLRTDELSEQLGLS